MAHIAVFEEGRVVHAEIVSIFESIVCSTHSESQSRRFLVHVRPHSRAFIQRLEPMQTFLEASVSKITRSFLFVIQGAISIDILVLLG